MVSEKSWSRLDLTTTLTFHWNLPSAEREPTWSLFSEFVPTVDVYSHSLFKPTVTPHTNMFLTSIRKEQKLNLPLVMHAFRQLFSSFSPVTSNPVCDGSVSLQVTFCVFMREAKSERLSFPVSFCISSLRLVVFVANLYVPSWKWEYILHILNNMCLFSFVLAQWGAGVRSIFTCTVKLQIWPIWAA